MKYIYVYMAIKRKRLLVDLVVTPSIAQQYAGVYMFSACVLSMCGVWCVHKTIMYGP